MSKSIKLCLMFIAITMSITLVACTKDKANEDEGSLSDESFISDPESGVTDYGSNSQEIFSSTDVDYDSNDIEYPSDFGDESIPLETDSINDIIDDSLYTPNEWITDDIIGTPELSDVTESTPPAEYDYDNTELEEDTSNEDEEPIRLPSTGIFFEEH